MATRGYRNNNPGNIRKTASVWIGQVLPGDDPDFITFSSIGYGYRAMFVLLKNYINKGYNTIDKMINRWAPSSENNTQAYITHMVQLTGISSDTIIEFSNAENMQKIVAAIAYHENGSAPNFTDIQAGYALTGEIATVQTVGISVAAVAFVAAMAVIAYKTLKIK